MYVTQFLEMELNHQRVQDYFYKSLVNREIHGCWIVVAAFPAIINTHFNTQIILTLRFIALMLRYIQMR